MKRILVAAFSALLLALTLGACSVGTSAPAPESSRLTVPEVLAGEGSEDEE